MDEQQAILTAEAIFCMTTTFTVAPRPRFIESGVWRTQCLAQIESVIRFMLSNKF